MASRLPDNPEHVSMSFSEHLGELRTRLIRGLLGLAAACVITLYFGYELVGWLCAPLLAALRDNGLPPHLYNFKVMSGITVYMKVGLIFGLILSGPWVIYQLWMFVAAGLYQRERRLVTRLLPFSGLMSLLGVAFLYYVLLPIALKFLIGFGMGYPAQNGSAATQPTAAHAATAPAFVDRWPIRPADPESPGEGQVWIKAPELEPRIFLNGQVRSFPVATPTLLSPLIEIEDYIDFVLWFMLAMAIAFQLPVLMLMLGWTGLIDPSTVARFRKYAVFACFAIAAVLTPTPDPINMSLMALPLWGLFEFGLILMRLMHRRRQREK